MRDLVALCPHVDRVVTWEELHAPVLDGLPRFRGRGRMEAALRFARHRVRHRPDLLLLPVRSATAEMHPVARAVGARARYAVAGDF
ncbi:MAG: hypothetical protein ICV87_07220, partial [Gemmatimonadetes bacterium]|nr:hypothetical protein [Gemmatimonadota bacterium]